LLTVSQVGVTILGQLGSKYGFLGDFWMSSREETHFLFPYFVETHPASGSSPWRVVQKLHAQLCATRGVGGCFRAPLSVSFDVFD